ncbi:MAG TPA: methyltransferase type 12, partial [Spirochaetaceae bacterium]|nr:methyltransferase type 12 [Spirochaetaceae bacterium]
MNRAGRDVAEFYPALRRLATGAGSASEIDRFGRALRNLQRGLTGDRPLAGASYFSSADYLGAYLLYYWPVSFVQVSLALEEVRLRGALPRIRRVLDIGAGPGPASFAAAGFGA